ncbi:myb-like protein X [Leptopilina heterotoma]|uniref:myb-like protein X n=1 Tax=Leptopilina heterotoma TaxID=63436 RepID=UPI001CA982B7|nr:myb-like protein X [Leptopilina heterotoma]XP_043472479.1 myb-like protein X [Leptopilina heterotoma]
MTTMESDSESQDSDDGRRFRFEATRKDATTISHSKYRDSPYSSRQEQQSRSPGPSDRNRKDSDKFLSRGRDSRSRYDSPRDSKDRRDRHSFQKYLKDSKDAHDSKHLKHRDERDYKSSSVQREREDRDQGETKDLRDSKDRKDAKSSRSNEKDSKSLRESRSSRDDSRKRSRDRSRSDRSSSDRHKLKYHEKQKTHSKDKLLKDERILGKNEKTTTKVSMEIKIDENLSKVSKDSACREFNISDFEIVSDLEEFSSDCSNISSQDNKSKLKKRNLNSKQDSIEGQTERKKHRLDDLQKVNPRNGNHSASSSNNNPSAFSDFTLDSSSKKFQVEDEKTANRLLLESNTLRDSSYSDKPIKSNEREKSPGFSNEDINQESTSRKIVKEKRIIGPTMPSSSHKSTNLEDDNLSSNKWEKKSKSKKHEDEELLEEPFRKRTIGPSLPPHLSSKQSESDEDDDDDDEVYGPVLPSHLTNKDKMHSKGKIYGPTLPSELKTDCVSAESDDDDDDDVIGPLPADHSAHKTSIVQQSLELRAQRLQYELMTQHTSKEKKREEWMTELPAVQAVSLGLGPRKFKTRDGPDLSDRSSWSDTPADKMRKKQEKAEERLAAIANKEEPIKEFFVKEESSEKSKKRHKSLLEIHQKKLKKKKKKEEKEAREKNKSTRRPFDRDIDLESNRFDEAQKKHIFMKAQLLDDRFTRGKM